MRSEQFEVGIRASDGRMMMRTWSEAETLKSIPWLKRENAKGADIYIRPAGDQNQGIVLVDDLNQQQLGRMKAAGLTPAAIVETSPQNYQAWVRLSDQPLKPDVATTASKAIATHFKADLNSADWRHFGRLAGFTNRKPGHMTKTGRNPWVLCHEANGQQASRGAEITQKADQAVTNRQAQAERKTRLIASQRVEDRLITSNPVVVYQQQLKHLSARYGASMDISRADYMICKDMAKRGYSDKQLIDTLEKASPELPTRKAGHENDYCQRTVRAAFNDLDVQQHLETKSHSRGLGR
jgi:hypothetical protein